MTRNLRRSRQAAATDGSGFAEGSLRCESFRELRDSGLRFLLTEAVPSLGQRPHRPTAAAAGGCIWCSAPPSIRPAASRRSWALIDDCAVAALLKGRGRIWLGLASETISLRRYDRLSEIARMVARTAFEQLENSTMLLAGTLAGMTILYVVPPITFLRGLALGDLLMAVSGGLGWAAMTAAYWPTVRLYRLSLEWAAALPLAAILYTAFTLESARRTWRGEGGTWKGRSYRGGVSGKR